MWVLRPVIAGCIKYTDLLDGSPLDLADIALLNDALDVEAENQRRIEDALAAQAKER